MLCGTSKWFTRKISTFSLPEEGEHALSAQTLILREILVVTRVLLSSPDHHLTSGNNPEKPTQQRIGHDAEEEPSKHFKRIVGTRNKSEQRALGNVAFFGTRRTKIGENHMGMEVTNFHQLKTRKNNQERRNDRQTNEKKYRPRTKQPKYK
jgi:hypothetical protein